MFKKFSLVLAVSLAVMSLGVNVSAKPVKPIIPVKLVKQVRHIKPIKHVKPSKPAETSAAVLDTNFNHRSLGGWNLKQQDGAFAQMKVKNDQLAVKVLNNGQNNWSLALTHSIESLEVGAEYIVEFDVSSSKEASMYAKIGDVEAPYREFWNNHYAPFSISSVKQTVSQQFTVNDSGEAEEIAFHLGGELAGEGPYVVYFDNIKITKVEQTNVEPTNDLINYNFSDNMIGDWKLNVGENAKAEAYVSDNKINVEINENGENNWDVALTHKIGDLENGAKYRVEFKVNSKNDTKIYAKIGDVGAPYAEHWNNIWTPITVQANTDMTIAQEFVMDGDSDNDEIAFHMGGVLAGEFTNVISFDDIKITKVESTNVEPTNELINYNFSDNMIGDWKLNVGESANSKVFVSDNKINVEINENGENNWDVALTHKLGALENGAKYRVEFKVSSKNDAKIYAKIGDIGDPYAEHWNNTWAPITIPANTDMTITQEFIMEGDSDNDEIAFHMGGVLAGELTNVISFDDIGITKI